MLVYLHEVHSVILQLAFVEHFPCARFLCVRCGDEKQNAPLEELRASSEDDLCKYIMINVVGVQSEDAKSGGDMREYTLGCVRDRRDQGGL